MKKITTVLMDYDGTIHDWDSVLQRTLNGILNLSGEELLRTWTFEIHRGVVHTQFMERHDDMIFHCRLLFRHLGLPYDAGTVELICRRFEEAGERARNDPIYFPDAIPALDAIRGMGLRLCLSTGTYAEVKAETLARVKGTDYFDHVFSEPAIGCFKTEPEYYRTVLEWARSRPGETVSVGDTPLSDIRPARMVGIRTIWVNRRGEPEPSAEDERADHEVGGLLEAVRLIGDWI
jgi:HAD superfamily hydrolase (TIGR01549 family)